MLNHRYPRPSSLHSLIVNGRKYFTEMELEKFLHELLTETPVALEIAEDESKAVQRFLGELKYLDKVGLGAVLLLYGNLLTMLLLPLAVLAGMVFQVHFILLVAMPVWRPRTFLGDCPELLPVLPWV